MNCNQPVFGQVEFFLWRVCADGKQKIVFAERDLTLKFRGSRNQRLLHLKDGEITKVE